MDLAYQHEGKSPHPQAMSDNSPLFVSASELLAHSIDLYVAGNERKFKFVILHLANAVELILKDRVIDTGTSIYKGQSTVTIGIWEAFGILEKAGVALPERPIIELLIDDRNTIQHRFGFPNADAVFYYLDEVLKFFRRFVKAEYDVELTELLKLYVSDEHLATVGLLEKKNETDPLDKLFEISPEAAVMQAFGQIERELVENLASEQDLRAELLRAPSREFSRVITEIENAGYLGTDALRQWEFLRSMRNRAAHSAHFAEDIDHVDWGAALSVAKGLLVGIENAKQGGLLARIRESMEEALRARRVARQSLRYPRADGSRAIAPMARREQQGEDTPGPAA